MFDLDLLTDLFQVPALKDAIQTGRFVTSQTWQPINNLTPV